MIIINKLKVEEHHQQLHVININTDSQQIDMQVSMINTVSDSQQTCTSM